MNKIPVRTSHTSPSEPSEASARANQEALPECRKNQWIELQTHHYIDILNVVRLIESDPSVANSNYKCQHRGSG